MTRLFLVGLALVGLLGLTACGPQTASLVSTGCSFVPIISATSDVLDENVELAIAAGCSVTAATVAAENIQEQAIRDALEDVPARSSGT